MLTLLFLLLVIPIINWVAVKHFHPKMKSLKRFSFWFITTWIIELVVFVSYIAVS